MTDHNSDPSGQPSPEQCAELFKSGEAFEAMRSWFSLPEETRNGAIDSAILAVAEQGINMRDGMRRAKELEYKHLWPLQHLAVLSSPAAQKMFTIERDGTELSKEDFRGFDHNSSTGINAFLDATERIEAETGEFLDLTYHPESDDFNDPADFFKREIPVDEMGKLLHSLVDNLPADHDFFNSRREVDERLGRDVEVGNLIREIIPPVRCVDLIADDELMECLPNAEIVFRLDREPFGSWMEQFLASGLMPKARTLEKLIDHNPEDALASAPTGNRVDRPIAGIYYHALMRRAVHIKPEGSEGIRYDWQSVTPEKYDKIAKTTADYLLSNKIMEHYLPYLGVDKAWDDVVLEPRNNGGLWHTETEVQQTGQEAVERKADEFAETVKTVHDHLVGSGDTETAEKIAAREIGGIRFADLLAA